jgi:hypothetical protein
VYKLGHLRGSHFSANFFWGSMYHPAVKLNTRGSHFLRLWTGPHPLHSLWISLWITLFGKQGRAPLSAGRQSNNICPLINLYSTLRHSRAICQPIKLLISNIQGFNVVELSTIQPLQPSLNCRYIDTQFTGNSRPNFIKPL